MYRLVTGTWSVRLGELSQPPHRCVNPLVGSGERDANVPGAGWPVELTRRDQDARLGQPLYRVTAVKVWMRRPEVKPSSGLLDRPAGRLQRTAEPVPPGGI